MTSGLRLGSPSGRTSAKSHLVIDGEPVPVTFRRRRNARRVILRIDEKGDGILLTVPWGSSYGRALDFAASQAAWIWTQRERRAAPVYLEPGVCVPYKGLPHAIDHRPGERGSVWIEPGPHPRLCVTGGAPHVGRRVMDWLKQEARKALGAASQHYAERMGVRYARLTLRDTASRWGSCSTSGALSYSWRLILAPHAVLDYVAAHEVAHLVEMNHSRDFWALVERHCPHARDSRRWLKASGKTLHRYALRPATSAG